MKSKFPWREAGPPNHHDGEVDSDQYVVDLEFSLSHYPRFLFDTLVSNMRERKTGRQAVQGYLAHKNQRPPSTLQSEHA